MTRIMENDKLTKSARVVALPMALRSIFNCFMNLRGAVVQLGARNTGSVEVTGSSPVSSTIFMYKVLAAFLFFSLIISASANSAFAQDSSSPKAASDQVQYVPDVVVLVYSGIMPGDAVSCTYNKLGTTKEEAAQDVQTFGGLVRQSPAMMQISSRALPPSKDVQTGSEFQVNGLVDYKQGGFTIEPFISTFKRFKNIEIVYIVNGKFEFRGLTNYNDKHVSISMLKPYQYRVTVKNDSFDSLNLPIVQATETQAKSEGSQGGGGLPKWLYAAVVAILAGGAVYFGTKRYTKTS